MENRKKRRRYVMTGICVIFVIIFIYYMYCLYVTKGIMDDIYKVANGEIEVESEDPYSIFRLEVNRHYVYDIKRVFTYCGLTKGRIYIACKIRCVDREWGLDSENGDYFYMEIEKVDGEWKAVRIVGPP